MSTHKNERRPAGRAAPVPVYAGWAPVPCAVWMEVAETLAKPWARVMACADLTVFQSVAIQPVDPVRFPSIGDLTARWGWSAHEVRKVLVDEAAWSDPTLTGNGDRAARWAAIKESRTSRSGSHGSRTDRARIAQGSHEDSTVEPVESATKARGFNTDRARIAITSLNTRVGSQSTDTEHRHREHTAPAPAVADLFTPSSQPDAATGEATGDTAPHLGAAAPLPKPKRAKRGPSPEALAAWPVALAWWARVRPENAARLKMERGDGALLLEALDKQGVDVIVGRLRQAAIGTVYMARQVRGEVPGKDPVDGLPALLRERNGITTPLDSAAEAEGYGTVTAGEDEAVADARSEAATAWFDMTTRRAWQTVNVVYFNAPDDFGATTGFDLADTPAEHARRANAFKAAGSQPGWKRAGENGGAGKAAFRERFLMAYVAGVTA